MRVYERSDAWICVEESGESVRRQRADEILVECGGSFTLRIRRAAALRLQISQPISQTVLKSSACLRARLQGRILRWEAI
jgi:hypothetical protein